MSSFTRLRQILPVLVSLAVIGVAGPFLVRTVRLAEVLAQLRRIPPAALLMGVLLVATVFAALALYEVIIVKSLGLPVRPRRARRKRVRRVRPTTARRARATNGNSATVV